MANKQQEEKVSEAMLDELLAGRDPREAFDSGGPVPGSEEGIGGADPGRGDGRAPGRGARAGRVEPAQRAQPQAGAVRGRREMELEAPRDRGGTFEPLFVEKYRRRLPGFDERVVSLYAKGLSTREIRARDRGGLRCGGVG